MEINISTAEARIAIEEMAQVSEQDDQDELVDFRESYDAAIGALDGWLLALRQGAVTSHGEIAKLTNRELKRMVEELDRTLDERFQAASSRLMSTQQELLVTKAERSVND